MWRAFLHLIGVLPRTPGSTYNFWSGFGSDLGEAAIIGGLIQMARKHNCGVHHCWRMAKHPVRGTDHVVCKKHHPTLDGHYTVDQIHAEHREANR